jgi:putative phosphoribosyl transferase
LFSKNNPRKVFEKEYLAHLGWPGRGGLVMLILVLPPVSIIEGVSRPGLAVLPWAGALSEAALGMFRNRQHAGELLAVQLERYRGQPQTVLLGLPRGGVPVAAVIARELMLPLEVLPVHKLGAPRQPELAIGAVAGDDLVVLDHDAIASMGISQGEIDSAIARERAELVRRQGAYQGEQPPLALRGETVILVDDGLATGYTMLAAARCVRQREPARVVIAVPVAPRDTLEMLRPEVDEVICVDVPRRLVAISQFYVDFSQVNDEEVREALGEWRDA